MRADKMWFKRIADTLNHHHLLVDGALYALWFSNDDPSIHMWVWREEEKHWERYSDYHVTVGHSFVDYFMMIKESING